MSNHVLISLASPGSPDGLPRLLDWYRGVHLPQVLAAVPSFVEADLYRAATVRDNSRWRLDQQVLTVYRTAPGAPPAAVLEELAAASRLRRFTFDGSLDPSSVRQSMFEQL